MLNQQVSLSVVEVGCMVYSLIFKIISIMKHGQGYPLQ